jgi:hypothetical protein
MVIPGANQQHSQVGQVHGRNQEMGQWNGGKILAKG